MNNVPKHIVDTFGRQHDYLRISLTERCNLRCFYCMPESGVPLRDKKHFMTSEEIIEIAKIFVNLGVKKIRITGGEPLIKKDIENILTQLSELPIELTITTNAILVDKYIDLFKRIGIKSLNVSLDSLKAEKFNEMSRRNYFERIKNNIDLLIDEGFNVKVNAVVIKNDNDNEIVNFIKWTLTHPVHVRFIEFMPFDGNNWNWDKKVSFEEIMDTVYQEFEADTISKIEDKPNDTAKNYQLKNALGTFGIISSVTNPFCDTCNRIRLTADGKIKNCLFSNNETDVLTALRNGQPIEHLIFDSISKKKKSRAGIEVFDDETVKDIKNRNMTSIGG